MIFPFPAGNSRRRRRLKKPGALAPGFNRGLGAVSHQQARAGYIPAHCLLLLPGSLSATTNIVPLLQFLFPLFLESGKKANNVEQYDYDRAFGTYHTSPQMAGSLSRLYDSDCALGIVDRETFQFELQSPIFPYTNSFTHHQQPNK